MTLKCRNARKSSDSSRSKLPACWPFWRRRQCTAAVKSHQHSAGKGESERFTFSRPLVPACASGEFSSRREGPGGHDCPSKSLFVVQRKTISINFSDLPFRSPASFARSSRALQSTMNGILLSLLQKNDTRNPKITTLEARG